MKKRILVAVCFVSCLTLVWGCEEEEPAAPAPVEEADTPPPAVAGEPEPAVAQLPTEGVFAAAEVLPPGEVSDPGALAVLAEGYRFQLPTGFVATEVDVEGAESAHAGEVDGTPVTVFVTRESFDGDTAGYAIHRRDQAKAVEDNEVSEMSSTNIRIAGEETHGVQWRVTDDESIELEQVLVHDGTGYSLHCVLPASATWDDVGSVCIDQGSTLHVAPPAD